QQQPSCEPATGFEDILSAHFHSNRINRSLAGGSRIQLDAVISADLQIPLEPDLSCASSTDIYLGSIPGSKRTWVGVFRIQCQVSRREICCSLPRTDGHLRDSNYLSHPLYSCALANVGWPESYGRSRARLPVFFAGNCRPLGFDRNLACDEPAAVHGGIADFPAHGASIRGHHLMAPILEFRNLSKEYVLGGAVMRRNESFREVLVRTAKKPFQAWVHKQPKPDKQNKFWALRDINFDVNAGDVIGIIGRNGAGKSTLLKIMSRITDPTEGHIKIRGRLASLLEVGTGFHPELTGRENIFLNGAILGMRKTEIVSKFDEIVAFSEVERFLDTPVKRYSSGMYVRLAFAVAAHLNPEILVVDEVLAVGDMAFQKKCLGKMNEVSQGGRTVLFVSHNMVAVENLCHRVIVLTHVK